MNSETRNCQNCKKDFIIEPEDFDFYEKIKVPAPTWCPMCRVQRRLMWRNERFLYKRKSDWSGKEIFSQYPAEAPVKVYESKVWYSDAWDPMEYGRDFDPSRPFLEQLRKLMSEVPHRSTSMIDDINSDYCNNATGPKNSFLVFNTTYAEDCLYGNGVNFSKRCLDISHVNKCEFCYQSFWIARSSRIFFSSQCENCLDVYFSKNLRACTSCFGCVNLRNKQYHIFNKPYTKEAYAAELKKYNLGSFEELQKILGEARKFWLGFPIKFIEGQRNEDVSGNYIFNSKNCRNCYLIREGENLKYCQYLEVPENKDCYDHSVWGNMNNLTYECCICGKGTNNIRFCGSCWPEVHGLEYCLFCGPAGDCFGCVGLRNKQYCILNRQYSKEEFEKLRNEIVKQTNEMPYRDAQGKVYKYGEFFPPEFSPFAYNETIAQEHFELTKEEAIKQGFRWQERRERNYAITLKTADVSDDIKNVSESILKEVIECSHGGKCNDECTGAFRIVADELSFYRQAGFPLPHLCPNCRTAERLKERTTFKTWPRKCQCAGAQSENGVYQNTVRHQHGDGRCSNEFETSYAPDRSEIVYCEKCYQQEVA